MTITPELLARDKASAEADLEWSSGFLKHGKVAEVTRRLLEYIAEVERLQAANAILNAMDVGLLAKECMLLRAEGKSKDAEIARLRGLFRESDVAFLRALAEQFAKDSPVLAEKLELEELANRIESAVNGTPEKREYCSARVDNPWSQHAYACGKAAAGHNAAGEARCSEHGGIAVGAE